MGNSFAHAVFEMTNYRRSKTEGAYYFFTVVTYQRHPFLTDEFARTCLRNAWQRVGSQRPFDVIAMCILPDHLHCIWKLPADDNLYSQRWSLIKKHFTRAYLNAGGREYAQSCSRIAKRERGIWQRRFWEHRILDEHDLQRHVDYIHFNPVKHGLVGTVDDWPWSTYHKYVKSGYYARKDVSELQKEFEGILAGE